MKKIKIYYAVTLVSEIKDPILDKINKQLLPKFGEIIPWFGTSPVDDMRTLFNFDKKAVESSDIVVAEVSYPSHGVGMEIMHAIHIKKPVVAIAMEDKIVSRMVQGVDYDKFQFIRYKNLEDLEKKLARLIAQLTI